MRRDSDAPASSGAADNAAPGQPSVAHRSPGIDPSASRPQSSNNPAGSAPTAVYRPAIDGLRAIAVVAVVAHHAVLPGFGRGFLGVDVFFVISGFLITGRLLAAGPNGPTQPLLEFWAGRARRIIPAMTLVLAVSALGCALVLAPQEQTRAAAQLVASDLFAFNIYAATRGGNYFAGSLRDLPFLHMWSLGVEEQFYVIWPLLLGPLAYAGSKLVGSIRRLVKPGRRSEGTRSADPSVESTRIALVGAAFLLSLVASLAITYGAPLWAFYGLLTRIFEFAIGGAAALWATDRIESRRQLPVAVTGMLLIFVAFVLTPVDNFPSAWPLVITAGTAMVIIASGTSSPSEPVGVALGWGPMRMVGRLSYSWYLWHWPALVLVTAATRSATLGRIACAASIALAALSFKWVEQPVRKAPRLIASPRRSLALGAALLTVPVVGAAGLYLYGHQRLKDPYIAELARAEAQFEVTGCKPATAAGVEVCVGGSADPTDPLVVLTGDSHAGQWMAAFDRAGRDRGVRVALRWQGNCPVAPIGEPAADRGGPDSRLCRSFQLQTERLVKSSAAAAVVMTDVTTSRTRVGSVSEWERSIGNWVEGANRVGKPVGLLVDNPTSDDPLLCMSRGFSEAECQLSREEALATSAEFRPAEQRLREDLGITILDFTDALCSDDPCPLQRNGVWIAARADHLNRAVTLQFVGDIGDLLDTLAVKSA